MIAALWGLWLVVAGAAESQVTLEAVLDSVETHLPALQSAAAEVDAARASLAESGSAFDPVLSFGGEYVGGDKPRYFLDASARAKTPLWGAEVAAGWRMGLGDVQPYELATQTDARGEVFGEIKLPLLEGGFTDKTRTEILVRRAGVDQAAAELQLARVLYLRDARLAWFKWLATGDKLRATRDLLDLAERTRRALTTRAQRGDVAPIEVTDARRVVVERTQKLIEAQRDVDSAAAVLGLYLRNDRGLPSPPLDEPPPQPVVDELPLLDRDRLLDIARQLRPDLVSLQAKLAQTEAKLRLASISILPKLDVKLGVDRQIPTSATSGWGALEWKAGADLTWSVIERPDRARRDEATATRLSVERKLAWATDKVGADLEKARLAWLAAEQRVALATERVSLSVELEVAARRRYELGDTDLFTVYLREKSTFDARVGLVDAIFAWHVAHADLLAATGAAYEDELSP